MYSKLKPINDGILVELVAKTPTSAGGIIIPEQAQEKSQLGKVIHAGQSKQLVAGDMIYYKKYLGHSLDDKLIVLREEDILGVV